MAFGIQIYSLIVPAAQADFVKHNYVQIYAGADADVVINGVAVHLAATTVLNITIRSISGTLGSVYLLGDNIDVAHGGLDSTHNHVTLGN